MDTRKNLKDTRWELSKKRGQKTEYKVTKRGEMHGPQT